MALLVHKKQLVPLEDFVGLEDVSNFEKAVVKRHGDVGKPPAALSQPDIMRGYLSVVENI